MFMFVLILSMSSLADNVVNCEFDIRNPVKSVTDPVLNKCVVQMREAIVVLSIVVGVIGIILITGSLLCAYKLCRTKKIDIL